MQTSLMACLTDDSAQEGHSICPLAHLWKIVDFLPQTEHMHSFRSAASTSPPHTGQVMIPTPSLDVCQNRFGKGFEEVSETVWERCSHQEAADVSEYQLLIMSLWGQAWMNCCCVIVYPLTFAVLIHDA